MSSPVGHSQIQGIIKGEVHFGSAFEGNLYSEDKEQETKKEIKLDGPKKKLQEQRKEVLSKYDKERLKPEKPKKKHKFSVIEMAEPFFPPVRLDELLEPQETDEKYWNKKVWKT